MTSTAERPNSGDSRKSDSPTYQAILAGHYRVSAVFTQAVKDASIFQLRFSAPALIARAESEILGRARLLWQSSGDAAIEMLALNNALRMLQVLKICHKVEPAR